MDIDDDTYYYIELLGLTIQGRLLKSPNAKAMILDELQRRKKEIDYERRCYPSRDDIQVYKESDSPTVYTIYPSFDGVRQLIKELGLPTGAKIIYCSIIASVERLFKNKKRYFKKLQNYTVEEFGLRIGPTIENASDPDQIPIWKNPIPPDPLQYRCQPRYRRMFGGARLLQVWRTRIFPFPEDSIQTTTANPLTPNDPGKIYFEERWHPQLGLSRLIGGLENKRKSKGVNIDEFYRDALRILGYITRLPGPKEYEDEDAEQFERDVKGAYSKLYGSENRRPSKEAVAREMLMDRKTLSKYLDRFEIPWPPKL